MSAFTPERRVYSAYTDDFVQSARQDYQLPENYRWINRDFFFRFISVIVYLLTCLFGIIYCHVVLHMKIKNRRVLKAAGKNGYFLYGNHTQPVGDVVIPALVCWPKHIYTLASTANYGIPLIGRLLPLLGALPISSGRDSLGKLAAAVSTRYRENNSIVIFPEAHVWPYCTFIRPFPASSFRFPVQENAPSFCITSTYQKRRFGNKARLTLYVDGPFYPSESGSAKQKREELRDRIFACMEERSHNSSYAYIRYEEVRDA